MSEALYATIDSTTNLNELIEFCEQLEICYHSVEIWTRSLRRLFGDEIVTQRADLKTAADWYKFALSLNKGKNYKYCLQIDETDQDQSDYKPRPCFAFRNIERDDSRLVVFEIPALVPKRWERGCLANITFSNKGYSDVLNKNLTIFVMNIDATQCKKLTASHAAHLIRETIIQIIPRFYNREGDRNGMRIALETDEEFENPLYGIVPDIQYFEELLMLKDTFLNFVSWKSFNHEESGVTCEVQCKFYPIEF